MQIGASCLYTEQAVGYGWRRHSPEVQGGCEMVAVAVNVRGDGSGLGRQQVGSSGANGADSGADADGAGVCRAEPTPVQGRGRDGRGGERRSAEGMEGRRRAEDEVEVGIGVWMCGWADGWADVGSGRAGQGGVVIGSAAGGSRSQTLALALAQAGSAREEDLVRAGGSVAHPRAERRQTPWPS